jgi:hypothetical protein
MAKDEEKYPTIKAIIEKVDPMEAAIMVLGGTAASNGIVPPMTRLLQTFTGGGIPADLLKKQADLTKSPMSQGWDLWSWITTPGWQLFGWQFNQLPQQQVTPSTSPTQEQIEIASAKIGLFCSGAIEALIMYKLVSNPETFKALMQLPGKALTGVQGLAKVIPLL